MNVVQVLNVKLQRNDQTISWGFNVQGGKEFNCPLVIQRVTPNSLADRCSIKPGDFILRVGSMSTEHLTHNQARDAIVRQGNNLELTLQRGAPPRSEDYQARLDFPQHQLMTPENVESKSTLSPQVGVQLSKNKALLTQSYNSPMGLYSSQNIADTLVSSIKNVDYQAVNQPPKQPVQSSFYNTYSAPPLVSPTPSSTSVRAQSSQQFAAERSISSQSNYQQQQFSQQQFHQQQFQQQQHFQQQQQFHQQQFHQQQHFQQQQQQQTYAENQYHILTPPPNQQSRPQSTQQFAQPAAPQIENPYTPVPTTPRPVSSHPQPPFDQFAPPNLLSPVPQASRPQSVIHTPVPAPPAPHSSVPHTPVPHASVPHTPVPFVPPPRTGPRNPNFGAVGSAVLNVANPALLPNCNSCNQIIRGPFISAIGKIWCPHHFICAHPTCGINLESVGFVEEEGKLYCEKDFEQHFAPVCFKCKTKIMGECCNALEKTFHPECFVCAACKQKIGSGSFHLEDGAPYCEKDYVKLFSTKCAGCDFPIEAGDKFFEALSQNWHVECFTCQQCHVPLHNTGFAAKTNKPYCKKHAY